MKIALIILFIVGGLVVTGALIAGPQIQSGLASFAPKPQGTKVRMQKVTHGKLTETVKAPGKIEPRTKVDISAEVAARVEQLPFREGNQVRKGDMIVNYPDREPSTSVLPSAARSSPRCL